MGRGGAGRGGGGGGGEVRNLSSWRLLWDVMRTHRSAARCDPNLRTPLALLSADTPARRKQTEPARRIGFSTPVSAVSEGRDVRRQRHSA
jgi:hypothetical protein